MNNKSLDITLGFSTGTLFRNLSTLQALKQFKKNGIKAVELCFIRMWKFEEDNKVQTLIKIIKNFNYVSIHAPSDIEYSNNKQARKLLTGIKRINRHRPLNLVVFHPQKNMDVEMFRKLPFPVAFENMDKNKNFGRIPSDFAKLFDKDPSFKMVLDINHIFTNDQTMNLAKKFYSQWGDRIAAIHLSGFNKLHEPLYKTQQLNLISAIKDKTVPIIVESIIKPKEIKKEKVYILKNLDI